MTDNTSPTDIEGSTEIGTNNDDVLASGSGDDTIVSLGGDDTIDSSSGDDMIVSGTGDDTINSGSGDDMIVSGKGDDTIDAGDGDDLILAGKGDDTIIAGDGNDTIDGGKDTDKVIYDGSYQNFTIETNGDETTVASLDGNVDTLKNVELVSFDDGDFYIDGTNNVAVAVSDTAETDEDDSVTINLLENDFDFEGDEFSLVSVDTSNIMGTVVVIDAANGIVEYIPHPDFNDLAEGDIVTETFTYTISDGTNQVTTTVTVTVTGSNDGPTAVADTGSTDEDSAVILDVLSNDIGSDNGALLQVTSASILSGLGSVAVAADNLTISYDPGAAYNHLADGEEATVEISYEITDEHGETSSAVATVTVIGSNDGPTAVADTGSTDEDSAVILDVLPNDTDPDNDAVMTVTSASIQSGLGSVAVSADNLTISYDPGAAYNHLADGEEATVEISYEITDEHGETSSAVATVTVTGSTDIQVTMNNLSENADGGSVGSVSNPNPRASDVYSVSDDRFEVGEDGTIKLKDNVSLDYEIETEVSLTITLTNDGVVIETKDVSFNVLDMIEGSGQDGYISGAFLFADANENGVYDDGEVFTYTDDAGNFSLAAGASGTIIMQGLDPISGTITALDIATGLPFEGVMKAPPGSSVVSPLTTLIVAMAEDLGITYEEAEVLVKLSFDIDPTVDLNNFDAIEASREGDTNGDAVFAAGSQVLNTVEMASSLIEGSGGGDAEESIYSALASSLTTTDAVTGEVTTDAAADISDTTTITEVIETAAAEETIVLDQALVDGATAIITESNITVDDVLADETTSGADLLSGVTQVSVVSQGETSDALETADTTTIIEVEASYTGEALDDVVATAEVGDVGGISNITQDGETVTTSGDVTGDTGIRVDADDVTINNSGLITGNGAGTNIWGNQDEWGDVNGGITVNARNNTTINNIAGASIHGDKYGIVVNTQWDPVTDTLGREGGNTTVNNDGDITGVQGDGIMLLGGGTINNTGNISSLEWGDAATPDGVSGWTDDHTKFGVGEAALTLNNSVTGVVSGAGRGVAFSSGGIVNNDGEIIGGTNGGVMIQAYTPEQSGLIGEVNNTGIISGTGVDSFGVAFAGFLESATLINSGTIEGAGNGIHNQTQTTGMSVTNEFGGIITGDADGNGNGVAIHSQNMDTFQVFDVDGNPVLDVDGNPTYDVPVGVDFGDTVNNAGTINGDVNLGLGADTVDNSGQIFGAVDLGDGDGNSVDNSGTIAAGRGIVVEGDNTNITNTGTIESTGGQGSSMAHGDAGIKINGGTGATVTNTFGATIHAVQKGVEAAGQIVDGVFVSAATNTTVINDGTIIGDNNDGVRLIGGGTVHNTGTIRGNNEIGWGTDGISGWITDPTTPVEGGVGVVVTNSSTGEVYGARSGLQMGSGANVDNAGIITGGIAGISVRGEAEAMQLTADITNTGTITGEQNWGSGINFYGFLNHANVTNSGTIQSADIGIFNGTENTGMTVTNEAGGVISGDTNGDGAGLAIKSQDIGTFQVFDDVTGDPILDIDGNPTYDVPVGVDFGDTVNNAGLINGDVNLGLGADSVVNSGTINGEINLGDGDGDSVNNSGSITGNKGIVVEGSNATIINSGSIESFGGQPSSFAHGDAGIKITGGTGATITNELGATIHADQKGIEASGQMVDGAFVSAASDTTVINHGTIIGENNDGVRLIGGGSVLNTGTIRANNEVGRGSDGISGWVTHDGPVVGGTAVSVINTDTGDVFGARAGIFFNTGALLDNAGSVTGGGVGVAVFAGEDKLATANITNSGYIADTGGDPWTMGNIGNGILFTNYLAEINLTNSGTIEGTNNAILNITQNNGMDITNEATGVITGDTNGDGNGVAIQSQTMETFQVFDVDNNPVLDIDGNPTYDVPVGVDFGDTVNNAGTINGDVTLGLGDDSVTNAGTIDGQIDLGSGSDTVVNSGAISYSNVPWSDWPDFVKGSAVLKGSGSLDITNEAGGSLIGGKFGVEVRGGLREDGTSGASNQTVIDNAGLIEGGDDGIRMKGGTVNNSGTIRGTGAYVPPGYESWPASDGISSFSTGDQGQIDLVNGNTIINNSSTGLLEGQRSGAFISNGGTINNDGTMRGGDFGLGFQGQIANAPAYTTPAIVNNTGLIEGTGLGTGWGVNQPEAIGSGLFFGTNMGDIAINNSGIIQGVNNAVFSMSGISLANEAGGEINGDTDGDGNGIAIRSGQLSDYQVTDEFGNLVWDEFGNPVYDVPVEVNFTDTIINAGTINGSIDLGIGDGDSVDNSGNITGTHGIIIRGDNANITNTGTINSTGGHPGAGQAGGAGIKIIGGQGTTIINEAGATIHAQMKGVEMGWGSDGFSALDTTVINHGTIIGENNDGVRLAGGGSVTNSGTIRGNVEQGYGTDGVSGWYTSGGPVAGGAAMTVTNLSTGVIFGARAGLALSSGGIVNNAGSISGDHAGMFIQGSEEDQAIADVTNSGYIGDTGVGTFGFSITGYGIGFFNQLIDINLVNSGTIEGTTTAIVNATRSASLTITNEASGVITGDSDGDGYGAAIWSINKEDFLVLDGNGSPVFDEFGNPVYDIPAGASFIDTITNAGLIEGALLLGLGDDIVTNTGTINGAISFGEGNDTYDGTGGIITGEIDGGKGDDHFIGGAGNESYIASSGNDIIDNFTTGATSNDVLDLSTVYTITDLASLLDASTEVNGNTVVDLGLGNTVTLTGVNMVDLHADDFVFFQPPNGLVVQGDETDNWLEGSVDDDLVVGYEGHDTLLGHEGNDTLLGGEGNDSLSGGAGNDVLDGGLGNDTVDYGAWAHNSAIQGVIVDLAAGTATDSTGGLDTLSNIENISGSDWGDTLLGDDGNNNIYGAQGDDYIDGRGGNDWIEGGDGSDTLLGGAGNDTLIGGSGVDSLDGGDGRDNLMLDPGQDGTEGATVDLAAGTLNDEYGNVETIANFEDVDGTNMNDTILGDDGDNWLGGHGGNDIINGRGGNDFILLDGGFDTVVITDGNGYDTVEGFTVGEDTLDLTGTTVGATGFASVMAMAFDDGEGNTVIDFGGENVLTLLGVTPDLLTDASFIYGDPAPAQIIDGDEFDNDLYGGNGDDTINGHDGNDWMLHGGIGNDTVDGGAGDDGLEGGAGDDILIGGSGGDWMEGGSGSDTFVMTQNDGGWDHIEDFSAEDILDLSATQYGAVDMARLLAMTNEEPWGVSIDFGDGNGLNLGNITLAELGAMTNITFGQPYPGVVLDGDEFDNNLNGGRGNDTINGFAGNDWLSGQAGDDVISGGEGHDGLDGGTGNDELYGESGSDWFNPGAGDDLIVGGNSQHPDGWEHGDHIDYSSWNYEGAIMGATVDLAAGTGIDPLGGTDTIYGIENLGGGDFTDDFRGDDNDNWFNGEGGDDYLEGRGGNDGLDGGNGNDTLVGGTGGDYLNGGAGNDTLLGGEGYDTLIGGAGDDYLDGGTSFDEWGNPHWDNVEYSSWIYEGATQGAYVNLMGGTAIDPLGGNDTLVGIESVSGSDLNDTLIGDDNDNGLSGEAGNDTLEGNGGNDSLSGGDGNDTLVGGAGGDWFSGGAGDDIIDGGSSINAEWGGEDGDHLEYNHPWEYQNFTNGVSVNLTTGIGIDPLGGTDTISGIENVGGTEYTDLIIGDDSDNWFNGNGGDDHLEGRNGDDGLDGGEGNDTLVGGTGNDWMSGGNGSDIFIINDGDGWDHIQDLSVEDTLDLTTTRYGATELAALKDLANFDGNGLNIDFGNGNGMYLEGVSLDDLDSMTIFYGQAATPMLVEGDELGNSLEGGNGADFIYGNGGDDWLFGRSGNDTIEGGAGGDNLIGGAGDDYLDGGTSQNEWGEDWDQVEYSTWAHNDAAQGAFVDLMNGTAVDPTGGIDTLVNIESVSGSDYDDTLIGDNNDNGLTGNAGNDTLEGNGGNDWMTGDDGDDFLYGGDGDDSLMGGAGNDHIDGGAGNDNVDYSSWGYNDSPDGVYVDLELGTANDQLGGTDTLVSIENVTGSNGNDDIYGGLDDNSLNGNGGNDNLYGNLGNDGLNGGEGNDTLYGGLGDDWMMGGAGADTFVIYTDDGWDYIEDISGEDVLDLSNTLYGATSLVSLMSMASDNGDGSMRIDFGNGNGLTLANFSVAEMAGLTVLYGGAAPSITVDGSAGNDWLQGGNGDDFINGLAGNDELEGGVGSDTLDGGADFDFVHYDNNASAIVQDFGVSTVIADSPNTVDTLINIEGVYGSQNDDVMTTGNGIIDLHGNGGDDTLIQGDGTDQAFFVGDAGNDTLIGKAGLYTTFMNGGTGNDTLDSTEGVAEAIYDDSGSGVYIDLASQYGDDGMGGTDTLIGVEHVRGSAHNDTLIGDAGENNIQGNDGNDTINGGGGNDTLYGGAGDDVFVFDFASGNDTINGFQAGTGTEDVIDFSALNISDANLNGVADIGDLSISDNEFGSAVITLDDGSTITLDGVLTSSLQNDDFWFGA